MEEVESFLITNKYLVRRLNEVHIDMKQRNMIPPDIRLTENEKFIATLIGLYEATKYMMTK